MPLPTRPLGNTNLLISTVGFGAWAVGGGGWSFGWGEQDDAESLSAMRHAVELGVNWIDTAAVYGHGHSERVVVHRNAARYGSTPEDARPVQLENLLQTRLQVLVDESRHLLELISLTAKPGGQDSSAPHRA